MNADMMHPLVLAFVGDAYLHLRVREALCLKSDLKTGALHNKANKYVSAVAQAVIYDSLQERLTEQELDIARRARNAHNNTIPKNVTIAEYKKATALEAVIGYLYLTKCEDRLDELMAHIIT